MKKILGAFILLLMTVSVNAENYSYFELGVGKAEYETSIRALGVELEFVEDDSGSLGFRYAFGFNENWALELGYADLDEVRRSIGGQFTTVAEARAITIGAAGSWDINERFDIFARVGIASWEIDAKVRADLSSVGVNIAGLPANGDFGLGADGEDAYLGFGIRYALNEQSYAGLSYTVYAFEGDLSEGVDAEYDIEELAFIVGRRF